MGKVNLPKGWAITKLELLTTDISYGYTAPSSSDKVGPKLLRITDIQDNTVVWSDVPYCKIEEEKLEKYLLKKNDLVFARAGATVGKSFLIRTEPPKAVYASYLIRVRTASEELISLLSHFFNSQQYWQQITEFSSGIGQPNVNGTKLKELIITLPPLAEQKIIADKLDILLAQVEATKARLERIPRILKTFRQSVLAAAVSGKLTEKWREETECLDNVLHNIQKEKESWIKNNPDHNEVKRVLKRVKEYSNQTKHNEVKLPEMWSWSQLEDCVLMIVDCHNKTAPYTKVGLPLIRTSNIRDGKFIWDNLKFVSDDTYKYWSRRCPPEPGDIIFTREAPMGEAAIIPPKHKLCLGQRTMLIRPVERYMSAKFLLISLMDPNFRKRSEELAVGTGVKHYRIGDVSNLVIAVPPTEEQTEVVRHVEQLFDFADSIEQKANAALDRVNKISQSILAKAFRGDLTADWRAANPDLISGKNSAEALLEKIKAEREVIKRQPKPKRPAVDKKKGNRMSKPIKVVEALKQAGEPLSGQQLLAAAGYPNDSSTEQLEQFFLDIRDALTIEESIVKLERGGDSQDWFALANNRAKN